MKGQVKPRPWYTVVWRETREQKEDFGSLEAALARAAQVVTGAERVMVRAPDGTLYTLGKP